MGPLNQAIPRLYALSTRKNMTVSKAWDQSAASWKLYPRRPLFDREIRAQEDRAASFPIPALSGGSDYMFWIPDSKSRFSVASARRFFYNSISANRSQSQHSQSQSTVFSNLWKALIPKKIKFFIWTVIYRGLNTIDKLQRISNQLL